MEEKKSFFEKQTSSLIIFGVSLLCWASPFVGLGVFFPIGVLFLYKKNLKIKISAFEALFLQIIIYIITYPLEIYAFYSDETEAMVSGVLTGKSLTYFKVFYFAVGFAILSTQKLYNSMKMKKLDLKGQFLFRKKHRLSGWFFVFVVSFVSFGITESMISQIDPYKIARSPVIVIRDTLLYFFTVLFSLSILIGEKKILWIFKRAFLSYCVQERFALPSKDLDGKYFLRKSRFAKIRERILPGWGHIFLERYWKGFPLLFIYLLSLLFFAVTLFFYIDPIFALRYMTSLGLKPGIPDKEIFQYVNKISIPLTCGAMLLSVYLFSNLLLKNSLKRDREKLEERGLESGFSNNLHLSILLHLILLSLVFVIPVSLQRSSDKKKGDNSHTHFQPEKFEFYFIDPNIPDEVKDLNGGVVSGTDTQSKKEGEKIADEKPADYGKVKGYVKRIKGKKLPKTYSNYISAKMRGPENFMEYWRRAPRPYSSVVAYTITLDGEIIDIDMIETSEYPEQDKMTLELIESMAPVMPPPGVKGNIRVTELFWNGPIDPDAMPTPLQKEMVLMFDGRYMEEL